ncbi:hypothetical protein [Actinoplanes sp. NBRC 103695]|uniref:hypothetical protein n=1 Tax=Actinoplanes sp. NBRC 103695 TaxID=3032202 RepID=UPI0024A2B422|nr:hypothetical protein [Actinoplanes sp. NBRC 103695]GLY93329.1 hypothetical protein Acsp02_05850 [Actinoplanes sp. NBRC 103695]
MSADLTPAEYAFLIILDAEDRELSNNDMEELYQVRLVGAPYAKLKKDGYVVSERRGCYQHTITAGGRKVLAASLKVDDGRVEKGARRSAAEKVLWGALVAQQNRSGRMRPDDGRAVIEAPADLTDRIRATYATLAEERGEWVNLTALRSSLDDVPKVDLDEALVRMLDAPDVRLEPESHRRRIDAAEREAAIVVGGEARHKLAIGLR